MWEKPGRTGHVSRKLRAAFVALFAIFAISAIGATSANAAPITMKFDDSWINVPSLYEITGPLHAVDPTDGKDLSVDATGDLNADGSFTVKKDDFAFPQQALPNPLIPGGPDLTLDIGAVSDFNGNFNPATGVFSTQLPLYLRINLPGMADCSISPLNIALSTQGVLDFPDFEGEPVVSQVAAPFNGAGGAGATLGDWTDVGLDDVVGNPTEDQTLEEANQACQDIIGVFIGDDPDASFDGSIWLGGTVTGALPNVVKSAKVGKTMFKPKKKKVKAGKKTVLKLRVKNTGDKMLNTVVKLKSKNKRVKVKNKIRIKAKPGQFGFAKVVVKTKRNAKGKAKIIATVGNNKVGKKRANATVIVKKAKKKKRNRRR